METTTVGGRSEVGSEIEGIRFVSQKDDVI